ncbi:MAG: Gfo/Idh/MocA family protein [Spirosomataceae bacterium]
MNRKIRWGIIGAGRIAEKFASDLKAVEQAILVAVTSTSLERATEFAQRHNAEFAYGSYEEIFQTTDLDIVYIATPHTSHFENTILCLENKVAVLCEKPFAMNLKQVQKMIETAQRNDTFLMEAMWTRFLPAIKKTFELIDKGRIGNIHSIHADFGFAAPFLPEKRLFNQDLGGGALLDIGIYPAVLSLMFLGYPAEIQAVTSIGQTNVDETTSFVFKYESGATAVLSSTIMAKTATEAYIYGDLGSIYLHPRFMETKKITLREDGKEPIDFEFERETSGYNYEAEEATRCLLEGKKESDLFPLSMSVKLISLLDEVRQKAGIIYPKFD